MHYCSVGLDWDMQHLLMVVASLMFPLRAGERLWMVLDYWSIALCECTCKGRVLGLTAVAVRPLPDMLEMQHESAGAVWSYSSPIKLGSRCHCAGFEAVGRMVGL